MADRQKVLIVDDDENIAELISLYLNKECFETAIEHDGESAIRTYDTFMPDLIILDLMLPGIDGYQVCREIRKKKNTPIIMLSAKGEVFDKVLGLELGADDYMVKPFDSKELVARVKAILRRTGESAPAAEPTPAPVSEVPAATPLFDSSAIPSYGGVYYTNPPADLKIVSYPDLVVNLSNYSVEYQGRVIEMPPKELELLYFLASSPNQVFTREQLLNHIWDYDYPGGTRTVDVHIKRLREKIHDHRNWAISTVWGVGYRFEVRK